jgi:hypothetical protein
MHAAWGRAHGAVSPASGQKLTARLLLPAHAIRTLAASVFPAAVAALARPPPCWLDHLPLEALVLILALLPLPARSAESGASSLGTTRCGTWGDNSHSAKGPAGQNQGVPEGFSVGYTGSS